MYVYNNLRGNFFILTTFFGHFKQVNVKCHQDVIADSCLTKKCWFLNQEIGSNHFFETPDISEVYKIYAKRAKQTNQCAWKEEFVLLEKNSVSVQTIGSILFSNMYMQAIVISRFHIQGNTPCPLLVHPPIVRISL